MTKKSEHNYITIKLPDDYYYTLVDIVSEVSLASKKWKVTLDDKEEDILEHSNAQLIKKIEDITYFLFSLYDKEIKVRVLDEREEVSAKEKVALNKKSPIAVVDSENIVDATLATVNIVFNATHGYTLVDFATRKTVTVEEFYQHFMDSIEKWLRTAVFYGVGSYAD